MSSFYEQFLEIVELLDRTFINYYIIYLTLSMFDCVFIFIALSISTFVPLEKIRCQGLFS